MCAEGRELLLMLLIVPKVIWRLLCVLPHHPGSNGAVAGTISSYMSVCHNIHIPKDVDVVFVEYR